jgi:hypothetical protein
VPLACGADTDGHGASAYVVSEKGRTCWNFGGSQGPKAERQLMACIGVLGGEREPGRISKRMIRDLSKGLRKLGLFDSRKKFDQMKFFGGLGLLFPPREVLEPRQS